MRQVKGQGGGNSITPPPARGRGAFSVASEAQRSGADMYPRSYRDAINGRHQPPKYVETTAPPVSPAATPIFPDNVNAEPFESWQRKMARERMASLKENMKGMSQLYVYRDAKAVIEAMSEAVREELTRAVASDEFQRVVEVLVSISRVLARQMSHSWVFGNAWDGPADDLLKEMKSVALVYLHLCPADIFLTYELSILTIGAWGLYPA